MKEQLGDEYESFLAAYEDSNYHGLRINPLKDGDVEKVKSYFTDRPVPWCKTGYYYEEELRPGRHPYHHAGAYYIQEPSAMLVGELADVRPGMRVLDLCAAPGGKTSHLAGGLKGKGVLVANEIVPNRAKILSQNVERMGIRNCIVTNEDPDRLATACTGYFDVVVVDTPCSGEGMFRRDEIARDEWSTDNVAMCAERGREILEAAGRMLKYGGKLVYSTCTFAPAEDEMAIATFMESHPEYRIEKVELSPVDGAQSEDGWPDPGRSEWSGRELEGIEYTFRLWPHKLHGEGHYVAVLRRGEAQDDFEASYMENETKADKKKNDKKNQDKGLDAALRLFKEWASKSLTRECIDSLDGEYILFGDNLYLLPAGGPRLGRLRIERAGLQLGIIKKDRFEPSHALAMALGCSDVKMSHNMELSSDEDEIQAVKYLKGETIACDNGLNGWTLVSFDGYSTGWGKASGGMLKNHYPKGLRIMM